MGHGQNKATSGTNDDLNLDHTIQCGIGKRFIIAFDGVALHFK